jgi:hypothetical protein
MRMGAMSDEATLDGFDGPPERRMPMFAVEAAVSCLLDLMRDEYDTDTRLEACRIALEHGLDEPRVPAEVDDE